MAEIVFDEDVQAGTPAVQQESLVTQPQVAAGEIPMSPARVAGQPSVQFDQPGSFAAVQNAANQAGNVGKMAKQAVPQRQQYKDPLVVQAEFRLGPDSARKFQKFVENNYEPLTDEDFTPQERTFLADYEGNRARKVAANAIEYGGPIAAGMFVPGAQTLAGEMLVGAGTKALSQIVSPEKAKISETISAAVPTPSIAKPGTGTGLRRILTSETGVPQQATWTKQLLEEAKVGGIQAGTQAAIETVGGAESVGGAVVRTAIGTLLFPAASTGVRAAGATGRAASAFDRTVPIESAKKFATTFAGELQRPFTQKFLEDRADSIAKELGNAAGIDPNLSRQLADALYTPALSGAGPQIQEDFRNRVQSILEQSVIQGRRSGLSGNDLTEAVIEELKRVSGNAEINPALVDAVTRQADYLTEQATRKIDAGLEKRAGLVDERNRRALAFARRAEGRLQIESQNLEDQIRSLNQEKSQLASSDVANRERIDAQIVRNQNEINNIEKGFDERFAASKPVSAYEAGGVAGEIGSQQVKQFEQQQSEGFGAIRPELKRTKVQIDTGKVDKDGNPVLEEFSLEDLRQIRSKIFRLFDFNAPVQQGYFEDWQKLNKINDQITTAFDQNPALKEALDAQNKSYAEGIKRFKGAFIDRILRSPGEGRGAPQAISSILGKDGPTALSALKDMAGDRYETELKPILSDYIYNQIRGTKPTEFLNTLIEAKAARSKSISKEVANEFFPSISGIQEVAEKYGSLITENANLKSEIARLDKETPLLQKDIDNGIKGAELLLEKNLTQKQSAKDRLAAFQKKNKEMELGGRLGRTDQEIASNKELIGLLSDIKSKVKAGQQISDADMKQIMANPNAQSMLQDLNDYVTEAATKASEFEKTVNQAIKSGEFYGKNIPPGQIVDFLKTSTSSLSSRKRSEEFIKVIKNSRPELQADVQNILLGRIVQESMPPGKKTIDTEKMKSLIAGGDKPGAYNAVVSEVFGPDGVEKITTIADQLSKVVNDKESIVSKSIVPTLATGAAYLMTGTTGGAIGGGLVGFIGRRMVMNAVGDSAVASVGKLLQSPNYVKTVTTPIDQLSRDQIDLFNRNWSRLLRLETDRAMTNYEEAQAEERQMREMQRQSRRRD